MPRPAFLNSGLDALLGGRLHLALSRGRVRLDHQSRAWGAMVPVLDQPMGDDGALAVRLAPALADGRYAGQPLSVILDDDLVRLFMVPPPRNAQGMRDIQASAAMRFHALYGDDLAAWRLACDGALDRPFLACAMPAGLYDALDGVARAYRLRLASVAPRFTLAWNTARHRLGGAWLGVVQADGGQAGDGFITLGCVDGSPRDLAAVHRLALPLGVPADGTWLRGQVQAVALRHGLADPDAVLLHGGRGQALASGGGEPAIRWLAPAAAPSAGRVLSYLFGMGARAG